MQAATFHRRPNVQRAKRTATPSDDKLVSSAGLQFDAKRNLVWAAVGDLGNSVRGSSATQGKLAALAAFDATTGERRAYHDLGSLVEGGHFANDLTLDAQGQVYVTDSFSPVIYRLDARGKASVFVRRSLPSGWNSRHQHPPQTPLCRSTSATKSGHVDGPSALIVKPAIDGHAKREHAADKSARE